MLTKIQIATEALQELEIWGITSNPSPAETISAVRQLDFLIPTLQRKGICLSYIKSTSYTQINPNQLSGVNEDEQLAVILALAKRLCARYGVPCPQEVSSSAKNALNDLISIILPSSESNPYLPLGAGNWNGLFNCSNYFIHNEIAPSDCDTFQIKSGETDDFTIDFSYFLNDGETISSFTTADGAGITINSSSQSGNNININVTAGAVGFSSILITVTTSNGRINPETVDFNVS